MQYYGNLKKQEIHTAEGDLESFAERLVALGDAGEKQSGQRSSRKACGEWSRSNGLTERVERVLRAIQCLHSGL